MATQTLTLAGRKFVVIPQAEYRELKARAKATATRNGKTTLTKRRLTKQEEGDIAESKRRLAEPERIPLDDLSRELGFDPASLKR